MLKLLFSFIFIIASITSFAQGIGFGLKAGVNFANVSDVSSLNNESRTGFMLGAFFSPAFSGKKIFGYRTELIYSEQGYDFKTQSTTGNVKLNYLMLPQLTTINITRLIQLQLGAQISFLLDASVDSTSSNSSVSPFQKAVDYYNRLDYGLAGGVELHPYKGLLLNARYNLGLSNNNRSDDPLNLLPAYIPPEGTDFKNNVVQLSAGYRF
jgi:hypothetical protein